VELWFPPLPATEDAALALVHYELGADPVGSLALVTAVGADPDHPVRTALEPVLAPAALLRAGSWRALSISFVSFERGPRRRMSAAYRHWPMDRQWLWSMASGTAESLYPPDPTDEAPFRETVNLSADWRALVLRDGAAFVGLRPHIPGRGDFLDFAAVLVPSVYADIFALGLVQRQALRRFAQDLALIREHGPARLELTRMEQRLARLRNTLWTRRVNTGGVGNALLDGFQRQHRMVDLLQQIEDGLDRSARLVQTESARRREVAVSVVSTVGLPFGLVFAAGAVLAPGPRTFVICALLSLALLALLHLAPAVRDSTRDFPGGTNRRLGWPVRRDSTTTKELAGSVGAEAAVSPPVAYLASVLGQHAILALSAGTVVGLISFRAAHSEPLLRDWSPCDYVSTVIVVPELRRRGIARSLYTRLLGRTGMRSPYVATRTWSTNYIHLNLLVELRFARVAYLPDHRGPGIATVYYARTA
jgi:ribosomal protein S18 acetylase RimI-like enzyme